MHIVFRDYMNRIEAAERAKPPGERRYVPTMGEIAEAIGINQVTLSKLMSGKIRALNLDTGGKIMQTMRRYGFDMAETDLIAFVPESPD
jgi:hypothetical protein